ncbi:1 [Hexamita inflata]|uniref:alpha-amylase n=1 Tax=Hexamita inflata TaxID=28002 RepID=A0AA86N6L2_9EUKA|nr:1 [Hexamita inflata] [Hexamita inflata]
MFSIISILTHPAAKDFRSRRIYQLLTDRFASNDNGNCDNLGNYCGGTFNAMVSKLDYIKDLGYDAIWISPTLEQAHNASNLYHGYAIANFYATNKYFGSDQDLINLVNEAHKRDIYVIADVVYNHVGQCWGGSYDYSCITTFPKSEYYHNPCDIQDWNDQWQVQNCRLCNLPDLNQNNQFVHDELIHWAQWYQQKFNFDGFRIDTVRHINHDFWRDLRKVTPWFNIAEIFVDDFKFIKSFVSDEEVQTALNYPFYFVVDRTIGAGQSMYQLQANFHDGNDIFGDTLRDLGIFFENHDNPRFLSQHNDLKRYENAIVLMHTWTGIPILYYGCEQDMYGGNDPDNRRALWKTGYNQNSVHYKFIQILNKLRKQMPFETLDQKELFVAEDVYAFARGNRVMTIVTNKGSNNNQVHYQMNSPFNANSRICNILKNDDCVNVGQNGQVDVTLNNGEAKVYVREGDFKL